VPRRCAARQLCRRQRAQGHSQQGLRARVRTIIDDLAARIGGGNQAALFSLKRQHFGFDLCRPGLALLLGERVPITGELAKLRAELRLQFWAKGPAQQTERVHALGKSDRRAVGQRLDVVELRLQVGLRKGDLCPGTDGALKAWRALCGKPVDQRLRAALRSHERPRCRLDLPQFLGEVCDLGAKARNALLLLQTGHARADVVRMGRQHVKNGVLSMRRQKTGVQFDIPLLPELLAELALHSTTQLTFLVTAYGKPFTAAGFGMWFRDRCDEADLKHCTAHGLRKAAAVHHALNGATAPELMAWFGWRTIGEAQRYIEEANRIKLARNAGARLISRTGIVKPTTSVCQNGEKANDFKEARSHWRSRQNAHPSQNQALTLAHPAKTRH
jgi:integrase